VFLKLCFFIQSLEVPARNSDEASAKMMSTIVCINVSLNLLPPDDFCVVKLRLAVFAVANMPTVVYCNDTKRDDDETTKLISI
jgi:hypothetical protein